MDALKKAEREKKKAASRKSTENEADPKISPDKTSTSVDISSSDTSENQGENKQPDDTVSDESSSEQKDESWAFDTGELELEPLAQKSESFDDQDSHVSAIADDTTVIEPMPSQSESDTADDLTLNSVAGQQKSEFDHDATLPSERAIQSSLKDYFEASQSITMDQGSVSAADAPDLTERSVTSTSPLDTSATHVTAHTIFTAGRARQASTGLAKYALFGTLFLALGLGAVAFYYSSVTPTAIDMPASLPTIAKMVESNDQPQTVEVDVKTAKVAPPPPFEPGTTLASNTEDPVLAGVVKEAASIKTEQPQEQPDKVAKSIENNTKVVSEPTETKPELQPKQLSKQPPASEPEPAAGQVVKDSVQTEALAGNTPPEAAAPQNIVEDNRVVYFTPSGNAVKTEPEEAIVKDQQYQVNVLKGGHALQDKTSADDQPIEVMSAEKFSEGLSIPKNAIKITKGRSHRTENSDLTTAYQAYQAGDYQTAKAAYQKILNSRPESRDARLGIAAIAVIEGNYETAYRHYQYLLLQNPKDQVVNAALFNLQGNVGGNVNESQLKLALDQNPDSPQIHFSLGSFYAGQLRWPDAQQAFFDAYSADKSNADYAYNLAVSLDQLGQAKSALSYYRTALKLADKRPVSFNTSRVLARIQKLSGVVKH